MLDTTTKRNIDSARAILVGKVPDPKAQVEQITTALIYKFMDDMDKESQELGGEVKFFKNGFEKFSWTKLLDKRFSGQERLELYVQAITSLSKNPNIPQLFRDIFKDAFLPYRDPETLSLFLKEIDKFSYDHSENLGNAFEYLLSILGSQGDAGQFRTPRHIIDFIVKVVDPKKNESILDPACGTAGFLISAYKHILKQNTEGFNTENEKVEGIIQTGDTAAEMILEKKEIYGGNILSPAEKEKLMNQFVGYDISPDMVKLSLVNMYLHGFPEPKIYEYDTLTSEKRWNDQFDVILANPPFMSPKGGIRPHKRFSVPASRSEVLFVDYILEHLNLKGRAGIIVPEGIIFKTETAYKKLRHMLIEDGLFAVVSLPSGVFNPYAGVKTSILFFDNALAKRTDELLFIKIENDGFDLGAQRRKIEKNDLNEALEVLEAWKQNKKRKNNIALWVKKEKIAESGDYNLTGERYREVEVRKNQKWPEVKLGEVCTFEYGKPLKKENRKFGDFPVFGSNGIVDYHNEFLVKGPFIIVGRKGSAGAITYSDQNGFPIDTTFYVQLKDKLKIDLKFLYHILRISKLDKLNTQAGVPGLNRNDAYKIKIPLPPLEVQKEIVEQIEVKQNAINHAKEVIKNLEKERKYFGEEIKKMEGVEWVTLSEICEVNPESANPIVKFKNGEFVYIDISSVDNQTGNVNFKNLIPVEEAPSRARRIVTKNDVIISTVRPNLKAFAFLKTLPEKTIASTGFAVLRSKPKIMPKFLYTIISNDLIVDQMISKMGKGSYPSINENDVRQIKIPLPPLEIQKQHIAEIEKEEEIITANHRLIELMEKKIERILNEI